MLIFSSSDQKSLQSISRSVEVTDPEEPPVGVIRVLPAAEPLEFEELQTQVHDAPAGETSPLTKPLDSNEVNMRPEGEFPATVPNNNLTISAKQLNIVFFCSSFNRQHLLPICNWP